LADLQRTVYPHKWSPISCRFALTDDDVAVNLAL